MADYVAYARQMAQKYGIDPEMFVRQINQESGFNPNAVSPAGAKGIAQFMPGTAAGVGVDPMNPEEALAGAAYLMRTYIDKYGPAGALAAYNAGEGTLQRAGSFADLPGETQQYIRAILGGGTNGRADTSGGIQFTGGNAMPDQQGTSGQPWSIISGDLPTPDDPTPQMAQQVTDVLQSILQSEPKQSDPAYKLPDGTVNVSQYYKDYHQWVQTYSYYATAQKNLTLAAKGFTSLPDGTVMAYGDLTPEQRAQVTTANQTAYRKMLNDFGLSQFDVTLKAASFNNSSANQDFANKMAQFDRSLGLDKTNLDFGSKQLDRWLNAQQVANEDARNTLEAQKMIGQYGTPRGQTSFTSNDLGAGVAALARQGGIDVNAPILNYPGTMNVDPVGQRQAALAAMGVSAAPPLLPSGPSTNAAMIPPPPTFQGAPPPPLLQLPAANQSGMLTPPPRVLSRANSDYQP